MVTVWILFIYVQQFFFSFFLRFIIIIIIIMVFLNCFEFIHVDFFCFAAAQLARQFVCLFVGIKPRKSLFHLPAWAWGKTRIHSGSLAFPAVVPKVHRRPESLYVPTKVNTLQPDELLASLDLCKPHADASSVTE